jgi:serine/threonine-protein kinase
MLLENRYQLDPKTDLIGQGGFAKVYKAKDTKFDMPVAIKHFIGSKGNTGSVTGEIKKCIHFNHPNIIRYFDCFESSHTNALGETITEEYGVMEYANSGSLSDVMSGKRKITTEQCKELILGILDGLAYLHGRSPAIIHRDLKPSNILLHEENGQLTPKICDFGISKEVKDTISQTIAGAQTTTSAIGTIDYMAPEQIEGKAASSATDLWALGCIIYEYFNGQPPFGKATQGASAQQVYWKVMNGKLDEGGMKKVPEPFWGLVKGCLVVDVSKRIRSAGEAREILLGQKESGGGGITLPPAVGKVALLSIAILLLGALLWLLWPSNTGTAEQGVIVQEQNEPEIEGVAMGAAPQVVQERPSAINPTSENELEIAEQQRLKAESERITEEKTIIETVLSDKK